MGIFLIQQVFSQGVMGTATKQACLALKLCCVQISFFLTNVSAETLQLWPLGRHRGRRRGFNFRHDHKFFISFD